MFTIQPYRPVRRNFVSVHDPSSWKRYKTTIEAWAFRPTPAFCQSSQSTTMAYKNILVFGAGGTNIGPHILQALIQDGSYHVSVLARESSKTAHPTSVNVVRISDSLPHHELVRAFSSQDVVIATTGFPAHGEQYKLVDAAVEAGVKRFFPSEWGFDNDDPACQGMSPVFAAKGELAQYLRLKESAAFSWTAVATSIWLEW